MFIKQVLQWKIARVEQCLANMVASRAIRGMKPDDALPAVCVADDAIYKAEQVDDPDLSAQAFLWAGIANFYHGQSEISQGYLDKAHGLKKYLKSDADRRVLSLWLRYGVRNRFVEKRMDGYSMRFKIGSKRAPQAGMRRTSSTGTASTADSHKLQKVKPTNKMNDLPECDDGMCLLRSVRIYTDKK